MPFYKQYLILLISIFILSGCSDDEATLPHDMRGVLTPILNVHEIMTLIVDPSAELIWSSAGTIITDAGERDLSPKTDEQWEKVITAAAIIVESGNLLMMHGPSYNEDWLEYSQGLRSSGYAALTAAKVQDSEALFDAGGRIYQVCKACHSQFLIE